MNPTVAIVDDNTIFRNALADCLGQYGLSVILRAMHGQELLDQLSEKGLIPDVCLLDVQMPVMDGYQTARVLSQDWPDITIVAHSFTLTEEVCLRMLAAGADLVVEKNLNPDTLRKLLLNTFQRRTGKADPV